jgi:MFS family permease
LVHCRTLIGNHDLLRAWREFLFFGVGSLFERYGARKVLTVGIAGMSIGLVLLTRGARLWQVSAAFALMSVGWATMSGAAINIIVAPWFERRRALAVSWALNGASAGGVIIAPALTFLLSRASVGQSL